MKNLDFSKYWNSEFPDALPISHLLRGFYPNRWLRIHSLPNSKRYADSDSEYKIIFERQNQLMNDLIGESKEIILAFGLYTNNITIENYKKHLNFNEYSCDMNIDLHQELPDYYDNDSELKIFSKIETWKNGSYNNILKAIADDEIEMMFICPQNNFIIAPYDGGVDIIVETNERRDHLKMIYQSWLPKREDGL
jgi:hypothetical protein